MRISNFFHVRVHIAVLRPHRLAKVPQLAVCERGKDRRHINNIRVARLTSLCMLHVIRNICRRDCILWHLVMRAIILRSITIVVEMNLYPHGSLHGIYV